MDKILQLAQGHKKPSTGGKFQYGTAGFRMKADLLDPVMFTAGILASLRSKFLGGKFIGIMITASHNPPADNGVKLVDPLGEMLEQQWEVYATRVANSQTPEALVKEVSELISSLKIDLSVAANVVIARDSRESGPALERATLDGLKALDANVKEYGLLTTPELHYLVRSFNTKEEFGKSSEIGYYEKLSTAFKQLHELNHSEFPIDIIVDAANGIGAPKIQTLADQYLKQELHSFSLINGDYKHPGSLNSNCGADFVKTGQKLPGGIDAPVENQLYASFDGDADRVVFYFQNASKFHLLDGDKISTLLAKYFTGLIEQSGLTLSVGVVQTAYANGSSTNYLTDVLKLPVECTPTGVKHLHHVAQKSDVGIYFEANGHGTVLFSEKLLSQVSKTSANIAARKLYYFSQLINQTVGDAVADLLAVLIILNDLKLTPAEWNGFYHDLPNKLAKCIVSDRNLFKTTNAERTLVEPAGLQNQIDIEVKKYKLGRSFVRASGTEDAVRVYAEAADPADVTALSQAVCELVKQAV